MPSLDLLGCNLPKINSTLMNYYENGSNVIKQHRDDERIFGSNPTVAMLAFGAERPLEFIRSTFTCDKPYDISPNLSESYLNKNFIIKEGSLFVMMGAVQKYYTHGIKRDTSTNARYSITFREHMCKS